MSRRPGDLRHHYRFVDFLFYSTLLTVPLLTAGVAIGRHSLWGLLLFAAVGVAAVSLVLRFYCTHCPHYTREGEILKCMFFWRLPKFFTPRPGPLSGVDTLVAWSAPTLVLTLPLVWLWREPGLLVIYLLSLAGFIAAVRRYECHRCIYFDCPVNTATAPAEGRGDRAD